MKTRWHAYFGVVFILMMVPFTAWGVESPMINGRTQMNLLEEQVLSFMNYQTGNSYTWQIVSGSGTLSASTGENVTYTAPGANPDCADNPTIKVTDSDGNYEEIKIAVNCYWLDEPYALRKCTNIYVNPTFHGTFRYHCDGTKEAGVNCSHWHPVDRIQCNEFGFACNGGYNSCEWMGVPSCVWEDIRSEAMKASGCCPEALIPGHEPKKVVPEDLDQGQDPSANITVVEPKICYPAQVGHPITLYNGNNFESEADLQFASPAPRGFTFKRSYNSKSATSGPLGYGWTHTYDLSLDPAHTYQDSVYLKIIDATGRGVYFEDAGGGHYAGAFKERTYVEVEGANYVWYRLDGRRFTFSPAGQLIGIEDKIGNTVNITYDAGNRLQSVTDVAGSRMLTFNYNTDHRIISISGPVTTAVTDGIWVNYDYDGNGNLSSVTYADGSGFAYQYTDPNDAHNLTAKQNQMGHLLSSWTYDDQDQAVANVTRDGQGVNIDYVSANEVKVTDAYGVTRTYEIWDVDGRKRVTDIHGPSECPSCGDGVVRMEYDRFLRVIEAEFAGGRINQYDDFNPQGHPESVRLAVGTPDEKTVTYTFHPETNAKLSQTEPSLLGAGDKVFIWDYDDDGNDVPNENPTRLLHQKIEQGFTKDITGNVISYGYITTHTYNSKGQVLSIDGPQPGNQDVTTFTYDPGTGDRLTVTPPLVGTTTYSQYDAAGQPGRVTDPNGNALTYTYDGRGRIATVTNEADGSTTTYDYNSAGELEHLTQANGVTSDFLYEITHGRLTRITDPLGNYIDYDYDGQGNPTELSHFHPSAGRLFWKRYDYHGPTKPGKLWKAINPDNTYTENTYDAAGNIQTVRDPGGKTTSYDYDALNRLLAVTQPGNVVTGYAYDRTGNLVTVTDAENRTTTYGYDDSGRTFASTSPDTGTTAYAYNASGSLIAKIDANGNTVTYTYDALNWLTGIHFPDSDQDITYTYDEGTNGKGHLTGMIDAGGVYVYTYNAKGYLLSEVKTIDGIAYTTGYTYDAAGVLTGITYPGGRTVSYELDPAGRVTRVTTFKDGTTRTLAENISYLPFGPLSNLTYGNGTSLTKTFDMLYRLTASGAGSLQDLEYTLDPVGNIAAITDHFDPSKNQTFGYDDVYRLSSATGIYGSIGFTYNKVGNRLSKTHGTQADTYTYEPGTNRLAEITGANPRYLAYDANGNTTSSGSTSFTYNQGNRLIQATANSTTLGNYVYNGNGQRIIKIAGTDTTVYHYDSFGNLIGESSPAGEFRLEYVYLNSTRLAAITGATDAFTVQIMTSKGRRLVGVSVYAFTESGSYTGKSAVTDEDGTARFALSDLPEGTYQFRADYLSYPFWSELVTLPGTYSTTIQVAEETTTVEVTQGGNPTAGVAVYLFNGDGAYLGLYETTDANGQVTFELPVGQDFKFRADVLDGRFFSEIVTIVGGGANSFAVDSGGGTLTVTLDRGDGTPMAGVKIYLFSDQGAYLGLADTTGDQGRGTFDVPSGTYKIRTDYLGYQFWTETVAVDADISITLTIPHQDVTVTISGDDNDDVQPLEGLKIYLFTASGAYQGQYRISNLHGQAVFSLPDQDYKVRVDYLSQQFWSDGFNQIDPFIVIPECRAEVIVTRLGNPLADVQVYIFNGNGVYVGLHGITDSTGQVDFRLAAGEYNFRADYLGSRYFSGNTLLIAYQLNPLEVSTGGGNFTLTVQKALGASMTGVKCYLFSATGAYLGHQTTTSNQGEAPFDLADGDYKIRIDYLGYPFWTPEFSLPASDTLIQTIDHQDVTITVSGDNNDDVHPVEGIKVYLFTAAGTYQGLYRITDANGQVVFSLPQQDYKVRTDYLSQQFWSEVFTQSDQTITINEGVAQIEVSQGSIPLENVKVYVFNSSGSYLGLNDTTDSSGHVEFRLPENIYKFRADYQGSQYWATESVAAHQVNAIALNTGGGSFVLTVEKAAGQPIVDVPVYVFSQGGSYLGINARSDDQGRATFDLADGGHMFRADYLGYPFWTSICTVPEMLSEVLTISHQDVTVTVSEVYGASTDPLVNVRVYLFNTAGSYQGIYTTTDANGQVTFNLPQQDYKVRADYLGGQYWLNGFNVADVDVDISHGMANIHVTNGGVDVGEAPVYLFTENGSYLGRMERTNSSGMAGFMVPQSAYKFRVDYNGSQYWSDVVNILAHEETEVTLALDLLTLDLTNDPNPVRYDGEPPEFEPERLLLASIGSLRGVLFQSVVAQTPEDKIFYFINDHLGTPMMMTDTNGAVVWKADFKPFGETDVTVEDAENNLRFAGQYYDQETGLHYNYHRYYDPEIGRYLRADPIGINGGINLFLYAEANPIRFIDKKGLFTTTIGGYAGGGADISYTSTTCCINNKAKRMKFITFCVGFGVGTNFFGKAPVSSSGTSIGISSYGNSCPKTGDKFLAKSITLGPASMSAQVGTRGVSAEAGIGLGLGVSVVPIKACLFMFYQKVTTAVMTVNVNKIK